MSRVFSLRTLLTLATATALALSGAIVVGLGSPAAAEDPLADLPDGAPEAARRIEPALATPQGWPFEQRLSRTSGTGRLFDGASYWSDFVYDDHGATVQGGFTLPGTTLLAPVQGGATYPAGASHGNGADIFIAATGADANASYWRVDWNTLTDPTIPIAVWTFDTDSRASTGTGEWPGAAGVTSPGIEKALVVSSRGAWLHNLTTGAVVDISARGGSVNVDKATRSFVARVPRRLMPVSGKWRVRLAAGLASADGRAMAAPLMSGGPNPSGARPYNVGFRTVQQEPPVFTDSQSTALIAAIQTSSAGLPLLDQLGVDGLARFVTGNFWGEDHQADALASGDVSAFARTLDWSALGNKVSTPEPLVRGSSNRWYVSGLDLGQGVIPNPDSDLSGDGRPNFLGRIQPYAVYVPRSYRPAKAAPLTWILHSLSVNHNQYAA